LRQWRAKANNQTNGTPSFRFQLPFMRRACRLASVGAYLQLLRQSIAIRFPQRFTRPSVSPRKPFRTRLCAR
jgi:hypothetical protein